MDSLTPEGMTTMPGLRWSSSSMIQVPRTKQNLLDMLPPKHIADRLVMRFFTSGSASLRTYNKKEGDCPYDPLRLFPLAAWSLCGVLSLLVD